MIARHDVKYGFRPRRGGQVTLLVMGLVCEILTVCAHEPHLLARQAALGSSTMSVAASPTPTPTATTANTANLARGEIQTGTYPPIAQSMAPSTMTALPATYSQGSAAPISGAPKLPSTALKISSYPALDQVPSVNSPQVKDWLSKIDFSKIPSGGPTATGGCSAAANAQAAANAGPDGTCWWTCGGCSRDTDVVSCPKQGTWGASFDDGPSPETPRLLKYLDQQKLKTTFFVVGSRVLSRPDILQYEYEAQHQISVHTWSHPYLTTLSNEQIVAELGWSKQVIFDTLGVTPNTMRPPYGDIDDRVRYISQAMGLTPIIWTTAPNNQTYDTEDWKIAAGVVTPAQVLQNFEAILTGASTLPTGFIVLAHDLYVQSVALATEFVLPSAVANRNLSIMPIISCLGKPLSGAYVETAVNQSTSTNSSRAANSTTSPVSLKASARSHFHLEKPGWRVILVLLALNLV